MKFTTKRVSYYADVQFEHNGTSVSLGFMNREELAAMAEHLIQTVWEIGPCGTEECLAWMVERFAGAGVDIPVKAEEVAS